MAVPGSACLADSGNRVVIGERQDAHATRSGLLHQHRWRKEAVRVATMRVEIDFSSRGVEQIVAAGRSRGGRSFFSTPRLHDYAFYRGSTTRRMAVRSSFSMMTSMKAGRQIASIPVSRK